MISNFHFSNVPTEKNNLLSFLLTIQTAYAWGTFGGTSKCAPIFRIDAYICCLTFYFKDLDLVQHVKKNRDPRWEHEFEYMLEEPPIHDKMHIEVISKPPRIGLHSKVFIKSLFIKQIVQFHWSDDLFR